MAPENLTRRDFIRNSARAAAGISVGLAASAQVQPQRFKTLLPSGVLGANEKIRTGHIGVGGMGTANLRYILARGDMEPIAICDLWPPHRDRAVQIVQEAGLPKPSVHVYFEEVIANKDVDAVVISTPDHWHAIPTLMAADAGKDVFCEKPLATTIEEGRAMVEAVRRHDIVFQAGTQQRSAAHFQEAVRLVQNGHIGKVSRVATWVNDKEKIEGIGNPPNEDPPPDLDWNRYVGWTPRVPYNKNRFLFNFRWFLEYSGGKITDWGSHLIDIVVWAMGEDKKPKRVTASGGKFILTDNRTTPDQLDVLYEFDDYVLSFSNRVYNDFPPYMGGRHGIVFFGTLGTLRVDRSGYRVIPHDANGGCEPLEGKESPMNEPHWENFAVCIRDRGKPIGDVETCHNSSTICHLGTCAYLAGAKLEWDAGEERFLGKDGEAVRIANKWAYRDYQNGWSLKPPYYKAWG